MIDVYLSMPSRDELNPIPTLLPGTLDMLLLSILDRTSLHGYALARKIEELSQETRAGSGGLLIEEGSLYPALQRLARNRLVLSMWGVSDDGRRRRTYEITLTGRRELRRQIRLWQHTTAAVERVLFPVAR
jgi:PadR family transcriptional regulator, regulatory protein PadR